jgi:voltage-gated potassium channel Kch
VTHPFPFARWGIALGLLAVSVIVHALFLALAVRWLRRRAIRADAGHLAAVRLLIQVALWTVCAHLIEMTVWSLAYVSLGALPDFEVALYFSMITYTTLGYGDVVLPAGWRLLSGVEGLTGILMAGWSTAFLFAVVNRLIVFSDVGHRPPGGAES